MRTTTGTCRCWTTGAESAASWDRRRGRLLTDETCDRCGRPIVGGADTARTAADTMEHDHVDYHTDRL